MKRLLKVLLALSLVLCLCGCTKTENEVKNETKYRIGILQYMVHDALDSATLGFKDALSDKLKDSVEFIYQNASGEPTMCTTLANQFVAEGVDLILANATPALQASVQATNSIPILGTSITDYATALSLDVFDGVSHINVSGTSDLAPLDQQALLLSELFKDAKNVAILYCSSEPNSKYQAITITPYLTELGYTVEDYMFADTNDLPSVTTAACNWADVIFIPTDNTAASYADTINSVASVLKTPIVAGEKDTCLKCGVATLPISYYDLGYKTGEMAYEILVNGADIMQMPIETVSASGKTYVASRCEEYGIVVPDDYEPIEQ